MPPDRNPCYYYDAADLHILHWVPELVLCWHTLFARALSRPCWLTAPSSLNTPGQADQVRAVRLREAIGAADYEKLPGRLQAVNRNIAQRGLHDFPAASGQLLTGYAYGEYYDWDLYFENVYLSYFGVGEYNFTNFQVFMSRQSADGFISRTLGILYELHRELTKWHLSGFQFLYRFSSEQNTDANLNPRFEPRKRLYLLG